jgi:hypothetical protein
MPLTVPTTPVGAFAYHSTTQSLGNAAYEAVAFDSEEWDTGASHDTSTNNSRLYALRSGYHMVSAAVTFAANATGERAIKFRVDGTTDLRGSFGFPTTSGSINTLTSLSTVVYLAAGSYVEVMAYQDSGGALNIGSATAAQANRCALSWLGV